MERIMEESWDMIYDRIADLFYTSRNPKEELRQMFASEGLFEVRPQERFAAGQTYYTTDPVSKRPVSWVVLSTKSDSVTLYGSMKVDGQPYERKVTADKLSDQQGNEYVEFMNQNEKTRIFAISSVSTGFDNRYLIMTELPGFMPKPIGSAKTMKEVQDFFERMNFKFMDDSGKVCNLKVQDQFVTDAYQKASAATMKGL